MCTEAISYPTTIEPGQLRIQELRSLDQLTSLRAEWLELWKGCPDATPFQSPPWLLAWLRQFGSGTLCVLAVRNGDRLVGLLPCLQTREGGQETLCLVGTGISDYLGPLADPELEGPVVQALLQHLSSAGWRRCSCDLQPIRSDCAVLKAASEQPSDWFIEQQGVCPVLLLPESEDGLEEVIPAHQLDNCRYYGRKAQRSAELGVECATPETLDPSLDTWFALHGARWTERGSGGVLAHDSIQQFHREAAPELLRLDALRLFILTINRQPAAAAYILKQNGAHLYYLGGFDPRFRAFSPGTLLIEHAIREAVREGARQFDFLRGRESYKYLWGAKDRPVYALRTANTADSESAFYRE